MLVVLQNMIGRATNDDAREQVVEVAVALLGDHGLHEKQGAAELAGLVGLARRQAEKHRRAA